MKQLYYLLLLLVVISCSKQSYEGSFRSCIATKGYPNQNATENSLYDTKKEIWIAPQRDPYKLDNMQEAANNLLSDKAGVVLTDEARCSLLRANPLKPTHYALKLFPRSEDEQWKLELMQDVKVSYIPFCYVQQPNEQREFDSLNDKFNCFEDEYKYSFTYTDLEVEGVKIDDEMVKMPVLYVVWPQEKPLPEEYDYAIEYEVFIPDYTANNQALRLIEDEAIRLALGDTSRTKTASEDSQMRSESRTGTVKYYDTYYDGFVPLHNLKIRFQLGSNIIDTYTNSSGLFTIPSGVAETATWSLLMQHTYWKITTMNSTTPYSYSMGTVSDTWSESNDIFRGISTPGYLAVHPAVNFYYNGNHQIHTWHYDNGIRIKVSPNTNANANSSFSYSIFTVAHITVYQNNMGQTELLNGSVLHEFGHFTHFSERGGAAKFDAVHNLIAESYASYVGNYLCDRYYYLLGYSNPFAPNTSFTGQARQWWEKTGNSDYSPLFVDLFDGFNQSLNGSYYNNDVINGFSHSIIKTIAADCKSWNQVKAVLDDYIGVYYTQNEYDNYIAPYDYWFSHN